MSCPNCGSYVRGGVRTCPECGFRHTFHTCGTCLYFIPDLDCDASVPVDECQENYDDEVRSNKRACLCYVEDEYD